MLEPVCQLGSNRKIRKEPNIKHTYRIAVQFNLVTQIHPNTVCGIATMFQQTRNNMDILQVRELKGTGELRILYLFHGQLQTEGKNSENTSGRNQCTKKDIA